MKVELLATEGRETGNGQNDEVMFNVLHGTTDAPAVDIIARDVGTLVDGAAYTDITPFLTVNAQKYILDITPDEANETIVASFVADLSGLGGGVAFVFASGFLSPSENQDGPAFGVFAALIDGTVIEFPAAGTARLQVIHNAADIAADPVDVYLKNGSADSVIVKLDDFAFRSATPYVTVPAGDSLAVIVAASSSSGESDGVIATIPLGGLMDAETYVAFANGVVDTSKYAQNPDGIDTGFQILVKAGARENATSENVDFFVLHGSTDAPTVDIWARDVAKLVEDAAYTDITDYKSVPAAAYTLDITPGNDSTTVVASYLADLSGLSGGSAVVFASGFFNPAANQNGPAFGIFAALADGQIVEFATVTSVEDLDFSNTPNTFALEQNYPNPFNPSTTINFSLAQAGFVTLKVYNVLGQEVATLLQDRRDAGSFQVSFDASNLSSGLYFYRLETEGFVSVKQMMLIK